MNPQPRDVHRFRQVVTRLDPKSKLLSATGLRGGVSARVTVLEIERPRGLTEHCVVRQYGETASSQRPGVAQDEFRLLQVLSEKQLPTPRAYLLDESGTIFPQPYIVLEYIDGNPQFMPRNPAGFIQQLALSLSKIHQVSSSEVPFLPLQEEVCARHLKQMLSSILPHEEAVRSALQSGWPPERHNPRVLLHGDFWPGNVLWKDEQLVGIIDWEDAAVGDPLADLAGCRLEILWALGADAMCRFTHEYSALTSASFSHLSLWDLYAAFRLRKFSDWVTAERATSMLERYEWFVGQALARVGSDST